VHPPAHVLFDDTLAEPADDPQRAAAGLAVALGDTLRARQFACSDVRDRRGAGWSVTVTAGAKQFEIRLWPVGQVTVLVAVVPLGARGLIARVMGQSAVPVGAELRALCLAVHHQLTVTPGVRNIRWMLGGPPDAVPHVETPRELPWPRGD
jgi:hypothetical protein